MKVLYKHNAQPRSASGILSDHPCAVTRTARSEGRGELLLQRHAGWMELGLVHGQHRCENYSGGRCILSLLSSPCLRGRHVWSRGDEPLLHCGMPHADSPHLLGGTTKPTHGDMTMNLTSLRCLDSLPCSCCLGSSPGPDNSICPAFPVPLPELSRPAALPRWRVGLWQLHAQRHLLLHSLLSHDAPPLKWQLLTAVLCFGCLQKRMERCLQRIQPP